MEMHLKLSSAKWRPFCSRREELTSPQKGQQSGNIFPVVTSCPNPSPNFMNTLRFWSNSTKKRSQPNLDLIIRYPLYSSGRFFKMACNIHFCISCRCPKNIEGFVIYLWSTWWNVRSKFTKHTMLIGCFFSIQCAIIPGYHSQSILHSIYDTAYITKHITLTINRYLL